MRSPALLQNGLLKPRPEITDRLPKRRFWTQLRHRRAEERQWVGEDGEPKESWNRRLSQSR
jgi:hypothetical protein